MLNSLMVSIKLLGSVSSPQYPYTCESISSYDKNGKTIFVTNGEWSETDEERSRLITKMVAQEMGADPRLFLIWEGRETAGTYKHSSVCVHPSDINANKGMWKKHLWTKEKEEKINEQLSNPQSKSYWDAKYEKSLITTFKNNPYYHYEHVIPNVRKDKSIKYENVLSWIFSYGSYQFNSAAYTDIWNNMAPPWVFCDHDGLVADITAVWAARSFQAECRSLGYGGSYGVIDRRYSRGHCSRNVTDDFIKRTNQYNIDHNQKVNLGKKFPKDKTNRDYIIIYMKVKMIDQCLTKELFRNSKCMNKKALGAP